MVEGARPDLVAVKAGEVVMVFDADEWDRYVEVCRNSPTHTGTAGPAPVRTVRLASAPPVRPAAPPQPRERIVCQKEHRWDDKGFCKRCGADRWADE